MVKQIILVIECCMGYVKAVYLIGVPQWGTKSIKMEVMFLKCSSVWLKRYIAIFFYHMILMPFLHIRIKFKVGSDN